MPPSFLMDPLSCTASLIALSGAIGTLLKTVKLINNLKQAGAEITQASSQLETIRAVVRILEDNEGIEADQAKKPRGDFPILCSAILQHTRSLIIAAEAALPQPTSSRNRTKRFTVLKWVIKDKKIICDLQQRLNQIGNLICLALQTETAKQTRFLIPALERLSTKQDLMQSNIESMKHGLFKHNEQNLDLLLRPLPTNIRPVAKRTMQASVMRGWFDMPGIMVQFSRCSGRQKRYSFLLGLKVLGSNVVFARFSGLWYAMGIPNIRIKVQHLVPEDSEIFLACKAGDVVRVRDLLEEGKASLNDITFRNETPLTAACDSRSYELVEFLLCAGADPNQTCGRMQTSPLHVAFELNEPLLARKLLYHGADINYTSARGFNVIHNLWQHQGAGRNSEEFYSICSANDFNAYDVQDRAGWTCLHRASAFGISNDIESILKRGASLESYTSDHAWTPIHVAAVMNNVDTLEALSDHVSKLALHNPDAHGWTPLHLAVEREAEDTMKFLLKKAANPHAQTSITAKWFPVGLEHEIFSPGDLARNCGDAFLEKYADALRAAGYKITTSLDGDDVYWDLDDQPFEDSPPREACK